MTSLLRGLLTGPVLLRRKGRRPPAHQAPPSEVEGDDSPERPRSVASSPGTIIAGKYVVERQLGAGGMGVVVAARHLQLGQPVAIKFLQTKREREPAAIERFLREARAAATLSSDHVVRVLDVGTLASGEPFMVMEYLDGVDLDQVVRRGGPLPIEQAVGLLIEACEAVAEAHALGIVHRDLKPANLFLSTRRDGTKILKVLDFGISKSVEIHAASSSTGLTGSGLVVGSPGYMAPEQARNSRMVDARADVWALGVIAYELITGIQPFAGATVGETFARLFSEKPPSVTQSRPDVPEKLAAVIAQCLEIPLERRVQSVAELASQLLPFGSSDAEALVRRVVRWSAVAAPGGPEATDPPAASENTSPDPMGFERASRGETGPTWQRSSGLAPFVLPRKRLVRRALAAGATIMGLTALLAFGRRAESEHAAGYAVPLAPSPQAEPADAASAPFLVAPPQSAAPSPPSPALQPQPEPREAPPATTETRKQPPRSPPSRRPAPSSTTRPEREIL